MMATLLGFFVLCAIVELRGQAPIALTFEAATIKPSQEPFGSTSWNSHPGSIVLRGQTLKNLIAIAYRIKDAQVTGGPKWLDGDRFDINARAASPVGDSQLLPMLQELLAERFRLVIHREQKPVPGYAMVIAKSGLKIKPVEGGKESRDNYGRGRISASGITMAKLADTLSRLLDSPVSDQTGASGVFDIQLEWPTAGDAIDSASELATVLREQTGLVLEGRKLPVDLLVIDQAERPTEN
jgi:uncharacterized protein (TIGR03435 family)